MDIDLIDFLLTASLFALVYYTLLCIHRGIAPDALGKTLESFGKDVDEMKRPLEMRDDKEE